MALPFWPSASAVEALEQKWVRSSIGLFLNVRISCPHAPVTLVGCLAFGFWMLSTMATGTSVLA